MSEKVVVTGLGLQSRQGLDVASGWKHCCREKWYSADQHFEIAPFIVRFGGPI